MIPPRFQSGVLEVKDSKSSFFDNEWTSGKLF